MPETATPPETKSPFDLGDTSINMAPFAREVPDETKPRNPDGTFAKPETPSAPIAPVDSLRASMLKDARKLGFDDSEVAGMSTEALFRTLQIATQQQLQHAREMSAARTVMDREVRTPEPEDDIDFGTDPATGQRYTADDVHPAIVLALKENRQLKKELTERDKVQRTRDFWDTAETIDEIFESLGDEYAPLLGKGAGVELAKTQDPGLKRRLAVLAEAGVTVDGMSANQVRRSAGKIKAAAELLYGPALKKAPPEAPKAPHPYAQNGTPPAVSEEDWQEAALAQPTSREPQDLPPGPERAMRGVIRRQEETRRAGRTSDAEIKAGLFPGGKTAVGS